MWARAAENGPYCGGGLVLQRWAHAAEVGPCCRGGPVLQRWAYAAEVPDGVDDYKCSIMRATQSRALLRLQPLSGQLQVLRIE